MEDRIEYDISTHFDECIDFIHTAIVSGGRVLVHCYQGKSRSATVCCAYMMKIMSMRVDDALAVIRETRSTAAPNAGFMQMLYAYQNKLNANAEISNVP
jgi:protein-tyrosine phosphatase